MHEMRSERGNGILVFHKKCEVNSNNTPKKWKKSASSQFPLYPHIIQPKKNSGNKSYLTWGKGMLNHIF
jgi:hypothetical protein